MSESERFFFLGGRFGLSAAGADRWTGEAENGRTRVAPAVVGLGLFVASARRQNAASFLIVRAH